MSEQEHRQWTPYKIVLVYPRPFLEGTNLRPYFERASVETLGETAVDFSEHRARFVAATLQALTVVVWW
ncbi:MAG: hypothetical protein WB999_07985 [Candidatus Binataceae bacterium]